MDTHNILFYGEILKNFSKSLSNTLVVLNTGVILLCWADKRKWANCEEKKKLDLILGAV